MFSIVTESEITIHTVCDNDTSSSLSRCHNQVRMSFVLVTRFILNNLTACVAVSVDTAGPVGGDEESAVETAHCAA